MTNHEILMNLWEKVNECKDIPFSDDAYLNEDTETMMLMNDLVMISVLDNQVAISYSAEIINPYPIIEIYEFVREAIGMKPIVVESYYLHWTEENKPPEMLFGEDAEIMALKDKCFYVFKDLLQRKNMSEYLEELNPEEMYKC